MSINEYSNQELHRLVKSQKSRIYQLLDERDEARDIAIQLLYELRQHVETPATHASYHWMNPVKPATDSSEVSDE